LWQDRLQWDEQLSTSLQQAWNNLHCTFLNLSNIQIPRKVIRADATSIQFHGFCESSEQAYGACLYIRFTNKNNQVLCELLSSTSKVAPLKGLTILRLELCAAVLLSKLFRRVTRTLRIAVHDSHLWTDSSIALAWIQGASNRWKTFVGNRVALILLQQHGNMYRLNPILRISFHGGWIPQRCQHPHYCGMDHNGSYRNHSAGPHQKSLL
jgi:hypothetical protein